jgi:beta-lactamase class C
MANYAQGYTEKNVPARMTAAVLSSEAYGVKTTAADILRFLEANMGLLKLDDKMQRAITDTHTAYFNAGVMTQDLVWEQYALPCKLETLLKGNSPDMIFHATPVTGISPPEKPRNDVWINKTGSTNGFGAYVAFIPTKRSGIVLLANKSYPIKERVTIAHKILDQLDSMSPLKAMAPAALPANDSGTPGGCPAASLHEVEFYSAGKKELQRVGQE